MYENQPHPHLNPLSAGEETILFPPLQGEGQGGDGVFSGQKRRSDKTEEREPKIDIDFFWRVRACNTSTAAHKRKLIQSGNCFLPWSCA